MNSYPKKELDLNDLPSNLVEAISTVHKLANDAYDTHIYRGDTYLMTIHGPMERETAPGIIEGIPTDKKPSEIFEELAQCMDQDRLKKIEDSLQRR